MKKFLVSILVFFPLMGLALKALPMFNFDKIVLPSSPNFYLACPKGYCGGKQNENSPVFDVSRADLEKAWYRLKPQLVRTRLIAHDKKKHEYFYIQRSFVFRFPDYIFIRFVALSANKSSLMIYSHAKYGYYDFKVNEHRVKDWLNYLEKEVKK